MYSNIVARSAIRSRLATRQVMRSDLYHFENSNGQNIPFNTKNRTGLAVNDSLPWCWFHCSFLWLLLAI
ncbi:unnamed protein product [Cunninghamella echinulata]